MKEVIKMRPKIIIILLLIFSACVKKDSAIIKREDNKGNFEEKSQSKKIPKGVTEAEYKRYIELQRKSWKQGWGIENNKEDIRYSALLADKYKNKEQYELAIKEYKRIIKTWGHIKEEGDWEIVARAVFFLGEIYYKELNDIEKALSYYKKLKKEYTEARIMFEKEIQQAEDLAEQRISEIEAKRKDNDK